MLKICDWIRLEKTSKFLIIVPEVEILVIKKAVGKQNEH